MNTLEATAKSNFEYEILQPLVELTMRPVPPKRENPRIKLRLEQTPVSLVWCFELSMSLRSQNTVSVCSSSIGK